MSKYYLLTFNDDYGDEHNVPALKCMTEEEYLKWLLQPSGKLNKKYESQMLAYEENDRLNKEFWQKLKDEGIQNTSLIPKDREDLILLEQNYRRNHKYYGHPKKVLSFMSANLGNSGDGFEEAYDHLYLMHEFVDKNLVQVMEVNENFYNTFKEAKLDRLSLCNIFEEMVDYGMYNEEEENE